MIKIRETIEHHKSALLTLCVCEGILQSQVEMRFPANRIVLC